jgi:hypothetical protein
MDSSPRRQSFINMAWLHHGFAALHHLAGLHAGDASVLSNTG